jgi:hypothetical protein
LPLLPAAVGRAFARSFARRQCNAVDAVIAPSNQLAERLRRYSLTKEVLDEAAGAVVVSEDVAEFAEAPACALRGSRARRTYRLDDFAIRGGVVPFCCGHARPLCRCEQ